MNKTINGIYKHFKGNNYLVFGIVSDYLNNEYVFYKNEGKDKYWIRPRNLFFERVQIDKKEIKRFELKKKLSDIEYKKNIDNLINSLKDKDLEITHTENSEIYKIKSISYKEDLNIKVYEEKIIRSSGYLSDLELLKRMNLTSININNDNIIRRNNSTNDEYKLEISYGETNDEINDPVNIDKSLNPCSIDLHICKTYFRNTRNKKINLLDLNNFNRVSGFWKKKKIRNMDNKYFIIKPNELIITRTMEKIKIPNDCVGKIEIRSTYARLGLSITYSDFCNPGWEGRFPLQIKNNGKHKIILHPEEDMLQLSLLSLGGESLKSYSENASYMNEDGTATNFLNSKTLKKLKKENGSDKFLYKYSILKDQYTGAEKERFEDTFLNYCERNKYKHKNIDGRININTLYDRYVKKERILNKIFKKNKSIIASMIPTILDIILIIIDLDINKYVKIILYPFLVLVTIIGIILSLKLIPEKYCIEKFEIN